MILSSKHLKRIVFTGILVFIFLSSVYSQANRAEVLGAYTYNFAKLSISAKQDTMTTYNIGLVSGDNSIIQEFEKMSKDLKVRGKEIVFTVYKSNQNIDYKSSCLLFIGADRLDKYHEIFKKSKDYEVLLVSELYTEKREILLNLFETEDGKIQFEMNKGNIYERKIKINDEILLMGGTEIDLYELYMQSQNRLNESTKILQYMQSRQDSLQNRFDEIHGEIETYLSEIELQKRIITNQKIERNNLENEIQDYKANILKQESAIDKSNKKLKVYNDSLITSKQQLKDYLEEIDLGIRVLEKQQRSIEAKEQILDKKNLVIKQQRNILIFFIGGLFIISVLIILLLKDFREKKKRNKQLESQKVEISEQNRKLENSKDVILTINNKLNEKNEALESSLKEIKDIQNKLVHSEKMASLGVLSAGIAHEINNPINFVYAGINSLLRDFQDIEPIINEVGKLDTDSEDLKEQIKKIQQLKKENYFDEAFEAIPEIINDIKLGADRTSEIVKGLRNFSRMEKGIYEPLNINEGLDTSLLLLKNKYKNHIKINKQYSDNIPDVQCFPGKINQVFLNILANAIDAVKTEGSIFISTELHDENVVISIKDTGKGISKEDQKKIFDPFFTTKAVGDGTGLGLSITYGIIQEHNGEIKVESEINKGSNFIIKLPILSPDIKT